MRKGFVFASIVVVIVAIISVLYLINNNREVVDSMYKAVPMDAAFIADVADFASFREGLSSNKSLTSDFLQIPLLKDLAFDLGLLDSLSKVDDVKTILNQPHSIMISSHPYRKDDLQYIYYFRINSSKAFEKVDKMIKSSHGIILGSARSYEHATIQDIVLLGTKNEGFSYAWVSGVLILSRSSILLEDAIRQVGIKDNILNQKGLGDIVKTAGKTSFINFYINFEQFPRLTGKLIHAKYKDELAYIKNFGTWAELDMNIKPDMLIFNGFSFTDANKPGIEAIFKNQKPVKFDAFTKIPANASTFVLLGISNFDQYLKDYQSYTVVNPGSKEVKSNLPSLISNFNIDLVSGFRNIFDHEVGVVYLNKPNDTLVNNTYSIIKVKSREEAESMLNNFIANYVEKNSLKPADLIAKQKTETGSDQNFYSLPFGNIPASLFGNILAAGDNNYCTVNDNYIIFGNSPQALSNYLNQLSSGLLISNNLEFSNFSEYFSSQSNFFFYNKPAIASDIYNHYLRNDMVSEINANLPKFNVLKALVYQFNLGDNGLIYNNIFIKFASDVQKDKSKTVWETQLDDEVATKPVFIKNGKEKEADIFVQDRKNQIYYLSGKGTILWKNQLSEPIVSDIYLIDYYHNGKQQLLFNTRTQIQLIDRKGKNVETYPITLKSPSTNGMAVFDYDKKRDYRIFLATEDRNIMAIDKDGKELEGWDFGRTDTKVSQPIQFFRIENKDFIVFSDQNRLYIVDRKGKEVVKLKNKFPVSPLNKVFLVNSRSLHDAQFVVTDTSGRVVFTDLDGNTKDVDCGKYPSNHWFDMYDMNNDGTKDLIFTWNRNVKVYSQKGKELYTITSDQPISFRPGFYEFKTNVYYFSIVTANTGNIYLYKGTGDLLKEFPLKGKTQFSIGVVNNTENKINLIVGGDNNFLYDYSVQQTN